MCAYVRWCWTMCWWGTVWHGMFLMVSVKGNVDPGLMSTWSEVKHLTPQLWSLYYCAALCVPLTSPLYSNVISVLENSISAFQCLWWNWPDLDLGSCETGSVVTNWNCWSVNGKKSQASPTVFVLTFKCNLSASHFPVFNNVSLFSCLPNIVCVFESCIYSTDQE